MLIAATQPGYAHRLGRFVIASQRVPAMLTLRYRLGRPGCPVATGTDLLQALPSWAILVRTSVVVRRSWSTYATDTAPSVRSATAPLGPEQGIRALTDRPVA